MLTGMLGMIKDVTTSLITKTPPETPPETPPVVPEPDPEPEPIADADDPEPDDLDDEQMVPMKDLRKLRDENKKRRLSQQAAEDRYKKLQENIAEEKRTTELAKMEETDRLKALTADAELKARTLLARADRTAKESAVINAAASLGFGTPQDAAKLIDLSDIVVDENGRVDAEAVEDRVAELAESQPYLVAQAKEDNLNLGGPTNPKPPDEYTPMPKFHDNRQFDQLKKDVNKRSAEGSLSGADLLIQRRALQRLSGKRVQAERDGKKQSA